MSGNVRASAPGLTGGGHKRSHPAPVRRIRPVNGLRQSRGGSKGTRGFLEADQTVPRRDGIYQWLTRSSGSGCDSVTDPYRHPDRSSDLYASLRRAVQPRSIQHGGRKS
jgi:hypothetical protein